eukprot:1159557-Pelagomonas_calceolata.AAC.4
MLGVTFCQKAGCRAASGDVTWLKHRVLVCPIQTPPSKLAGWKLPEICVQVGIRMQAENRGVHA